MPIHRLSVLIWGLVAIVLVPTGLADDLEKAGLPIVENRDGYVLAVTEYEASTSADLLSDDPPEHEVSLTALLQPAERADVLCFATKMTAKSAKTERREELLLPGRRDRKQEFAAVLPHSEFRGRRDKPLMLAESELESAELKRPGFEIEELEIEATAVVVEERESEEIRAIVADRFIDIGHDHQIQVTAMEVDGKGVMTVKLDLKRASGDRTPVIDSLYALNADDKIIGGGRWTNELDLFAGKYEVEMTFPLSGEATISKLRIVLATKYEVVPVRFVVERLYQK